MTATRERSSSHEPLPDVFCHNCGHRNPGDANFCSSCGHAIGPHHGDLTLTIEAEDGADTDVVVHIDDFGHGPSVLVVKRGADAGTTFVLSSDRTVIGRAPDAEIFLDDVTVSRRHAEITRDTHGTYRIRDGGSLNGTYVNRSRIVETDLENGDEVQIGKFRLVFLVDVGD